MMERDCPFCFPSHDCVVHEDSLVRIICDAFPVSLGHLLVTPRRHVGDWFAAAPSEQQALTAALITARNIVLKSHHPDGFNIGVNVGEAAGQTVPHLHIHLIPRYLGDVDDPTGGVRGVIPAKANYLNPNAVSGSCQGKLIRGGALDPLLERLLSDLDAANKFDLAVAFILPSGVDLLEDHIRDLLSRGGTARILTGDYQFVTDPLALQRLLDLPGSLELRIYQCRERSFHPKAYLISSNSGQWSAYVGSSNLSRTALCEGVEWNYRIESATDTAGLAEVQAAFEALWADPQTLPVTADWLVDYKNRRPKDVNVQVVDNMEPDGEVPTPHLVQEEALEALEDTRTKGNCAGLVVLATGLGKTWLSAFDSNRPEYRRVLFVAHRDEILGQSMRTFRKIRPHARLGRYTGTEKSLDADVLFASVQTLSRLPHLRQFALDAFDYIIIDEFHHAAAATYRKIINYFSPKFMLCLTATPERTDGGNLLGLCEENMVYRCDIGRGITLGLLSPFHYYGVPDNVDYRNIPWRNSRFDENELTAAVATETRAHNVLEQL
ncbi:MAG: DEAD/DEAH box helicase family protein [bacterium]|nr:DEAD/DEAH box helicase family protein [bacterium]